MKLNFKLIVAALSLSLVSRSQNVLSQDPVINKRGCATAAPSAEWETWFNKKVEEYKLNRPSGKTQNISITIPVVVHVIHGGSAVGIYPNITSTQVYSQINVMNKDFGGIGYNSYQLANTGFSVVGVANTHITFCPAQYDPSGNLLTEPGIDRVNYNTNGWTNPATPNTLSAFQSLMDGTIKPATIWDPTNYFNIWVSDVNSNAYILGYATFPGGSTLSGIVSNVGTAGTDGIWVWSRSFGNTGAVNAPYNLGRTATHETGHWLGLRHIGGDGNNNPAGDCNATDYCDDTPPQKGGFASGTYGQNFGAPTYPLHPNVCSSPIGDMFMNFMDYSDDAYCYMFTPDQNDRMQTALANSYFRTQLSSSAFTVCSGMPLADFINDTIACVNSGVTPFNTTDGTPTPTYSWSVKPSAGITFSPASTSASPNINFPSIGFYTVTMVATNSLGVTSNTLGLRIEDCTGLKENSLSEQTIILAPNPTSGQLSITTNLRSEKQLQLSVYNSFGQLVMSKHYTSSGASTVIIDLSAYPNGVYNVSITSGNEKIVKRVILNK